MKYALLIYSNDTDWENLSEDEQKAIYGEYFAISETKGVVGGSELQGAESATTVRVAGRRDPDDGRAVRRDEGGARRLLPLRGRRPRRGARAGRAHPGGAARRRGRGAARVET